MKIRKLSITTDSRMIKPILNIFFILCLLMIGTACKKKKESDTIIKSYRASINKISVISSSTIGQQIFITVDFSGPDLGSVADHLEILEVNKVFSVFAFYNQSGGSSQTQPIALQLKFPFNPRETGQYIFKDDENPNNADTLIVSN